MAKTPEQLASLPAESAEALAPTVKGGKMSRLLNMSGTFLTVAILTVLIWVWAEQSQLDEQHILVPMTLSSEADSVLILVDVDAGMGQPSAETADGGKRIRPKVKLRGTRSRIRELVSDLQSGKIELRIYLSESAYSAGEYPLSVVDLLNADESLRDRGITAIEADPARITVDLDEWVVEKVRLMLKGVSDNPRFQASINPPEISVEIPSRVAAQSTSRLMLVELTQLPAKISPGLEVEGTVIPELQGHKVKPKKSKVRVTLQPIEQQTERISGLEIAVVLPSEMVGAYDLEWESEASKVIDIKVAGPPGEVDKLKISPKKYIRAYIELSSLDAEPTETYPPVTVRVDFRGVSDVKLAEPEKTVRVRLRKKPN